jgi:hypothetical protein
MPTPELTADLGPAIRRLRKIIPLQFGEYVHAGTSPENWLRVETLHRGGMLEIAKFKYATDASFFVILSCIAGQLLDERDALLAAAKERDALRSRLERAEKALRGVIRVADRDTLEFCVARAALAQRQQP